jgi:hypothetical protein
MTEINNSTVFNGNAYSFAHCLEHVETDIDIIWFVHDNVVYNVFSADFGSFDYEKADTIDTENVLNFINKG